MDAVIFFGIFIAIVMLYMRKESRIYTAKKPRTFAEIERRNP
jgi:hypothetical protein